MRTTSSTAAAAAFVQSMIPTDSIDATLRLLVTGLLLVWNIVEGAVFENEYPTAFVKLYTLPIWRFLFLMAMIAGARWCPSVGIMLAFTTFFYVMDMEVTMDKWK
jgi:hypothetical protein